MKKILSIFLLLVLGTPLFAQDDGGSSKKFNFGLKATPAISWLKPDNTALSNDGAKLGFGYGIMTEFNFTENYGFSTGLEVTNFRGAYRYSINILGVSAENSTKLKLQYLTIPLTLKMKTKEIGAMKYFGQFGVNNSFRLKAKGDIKTNVAGTVTTLNDEDIADDINLIRESLIIALGVEYNLAGSTSAVASVAYENGFTNLIQDPTVGKITSKGIVLTVGILF